MKNGLTYTEIDGILINIKKGWDKISAVIILVAATDIILPLVSCTSPLED